VHLDDPTGQTDRQTDRVQYETKPHNERAHKQSLTDGDRLQLHDARSQRRKITKTEFLNKQQRADDKPIKKALNRHAEKDGRVISTVRCECDKWHAFSCLTYWVKQNASGLSTQIKEWRQQPVRKISSPSYIWTPPSIPKKTLFSGKNCGIFK